MNAAPNISNSTTKIQIRTTSLRRTGRIRLLTKIKRMGFSGLFALSSANFPTISSPRLKRAQPVKASETTLSTGEM